MSKKRIFEKEKRYNNINAKLDKALNTLSRYRLIMILLILFSLMFTIYSIFFLALSLLFVLIFFLLVKKFNIIQEKINRIKYIKLFFNDYCKVKLNKEWRLLDNNIDIENDNYVLKDLAFIGTGSFLHKIQLGISRLAKYKLKSIIKVDTLKLDELKKRQKIVKELSSRISSRIKLFFEIDKINKSELNQLDFINWLNSKSQKSNFIFFKILSVTFLINILISASLNLVYPIVIQFFIQLILVNLLAKEYWIPVYKEALQKEGEFLSYKRIILILTNHYSAVLKDVDENNFLTKNKLNLINGILQFQKLSEKLSVIYSGMGYVLLNSIMFWDCWYIPSLIKWKNEQRELFPKFLDILSTIEYLEMFAHYHYLFPETNFPKFIDKGFNAKELGHPLINSNDIITNDFSLSDNKMFIITGSNMAGKTTFLRSIGLNLILAYIGCPVYAKTFETQYFKIHSSININDDINDGISLFYAEVKRLKQIVESAEKKNNVIFFIDEMLKGTNAKERTEASIKVITRLVRSDSIGFFSTHDLNLAELNKSFQQIQNFHFSESDDKEKLTFDYKLKEGAVNSTNALDILKNEGLF